MKNKDRIILKKIIEYIHEIYGFMEGYTKETFNNDRKTINACVFNLSQIGELAGKISDDIIKESQSIEWKGLRGLRNRIVHDYEGINLDMVWGFLEEELAELEEKINTIIDE